MGMGNMHRSNVLFAVWFDLAGKPELALWICNPTTAIKIERLKNVTIFWVCSTELKSIQNMFAMDWCTGSSLVGAGVDIINP